MRYLKYFYIHGFPVKKTPNNKIKLLKQEKIYLFSKFKRRFDVCLSLPTFVLIKNFFNKQYKIKDIKIDIRCHKFSNGNFFRVHMDGYVGGYALTLSLNKNWKWD